MTIAISPTTLAAVFGLFIGIAFAPVWWAMAAGAMDAVRLFVLWWRYFWWRWWRGGK